MSKSNGNVKSMIWSFDKAITGSSKEFTGFLEFSESCWDYGNNRRV